MLIVSNFGLQHNYKRINDMSKGKPRRDGSGNGTRSNRGRGGCSTTRSTGK